MLKAMISLASRSITGSSFDDRLTGTDANNSLSGGGGNDALIGGDGADILDGGDGVDTAIYGKSNQGISIDLANETASGGSAEGDTLTRIENITGSNYNDVLIGDDNNNTFLGGLSIA